MLKQKTKFAKNKKISTKKFETKTGINIQCHLGNESVTGLGAGDTFYIHDFIDRVEADQIFKNLVREIDFVPMFNLSAAMDNAIPIPRLVSAQTSKNGDGEAMYRMPGCNQSNIRTKAWTPTVKEVCNRAELAIGSELNHAVCSLFRNQDDSLGFHKDKMIDLADRSLILSLSFGAARPMLIEEVGGKRKHTIVLQPGSLLAIGPETNDLFVHAIPKLIDPVGPRISLSVRQSSTFVDQADGQLVGKGAEHQTKNYPFIKSYENLGACTNEVKQKIDSCQQAADQYLQQLRA